MTEGAGSVRPFFVDPEDPPAKRQIMIHALRLFTEKGLCETTIRDIGEAAGYTNPALYKHFESKDDLAVHLLVSCHRRLTGTLEAAIREHTWFNEQFIAFVDTFCLQFDEYPEAFLYVADNVQTFWPRVSGVLGGATLMDLVSGILRKGVEEQKLEPHLTVDLTAGAMVGMLQQLARLWYLDLIPGPAGRWSGTIHRMLRRMVLA